MAMKEFHSIQVVRGLNYVIPGMIVVENTNVNTTLLHFY